jgi:hypothetical protein
MKTSLSVCILELIGKCLDDQNNGSLLPNLCKDAYTHDKEIVTGTPFCQGQSGRTVVDLAKVVNDGSGLVCTATIVY